MTTHAKRAEDVQTEPGGDVEKAVYVYGIIGRREELPDELPSVGDDEAEVVLASRGELSALISEVRLVRPLGTREDLLAHERVLDTLAAETTVIPMRFGSVVTTADAVVEELLEPHHDRFEAMLTELEGLVQFTVRGRYAESAHLREIVHEVPEVRQLREDLSGLPEDAGYAERVRLGELVSNAVDQKRESDAETLVASLEPFSVASLPHAVAAEDDAVHVTFLVDREQIPQFEQAMDELGERWAGRIDLRLIGPLAPYDFVPEN
ncbi:GvpL/GvpF family gas vesicle protein [Saccharopolyspora sp. NPDC002686]|uniref:GvpL/GvpF family gas vesicle protein n=1 Tax=Saccharopolyspora sp. NPDC002686 TaxID=3154541 RepID=UPI003333F851